LIGVFFRKFHHHLPRRSDDLPCQEDVLQPECLACASTAGTGDLLPVLFRAHIIGKGNKQHLVNPKMVGNAAHYLKDWLAVRCEAPGAFFCFISYRGNLRRLDKNLTPKTLHSILKNRVARAGPPLTTWHDFRRTILSDVIARSGFTTAQHLAGSSSSATTARYDRLSRENVQEAINYRSDASSPTGASL